MSLKTFPFLQTQEGYYFDEAAALKVVDFIERFCRLADPMGAKFILLPWEKQIVLDVFGWLNKETGERRFTNVYIEIPRKNGKTYFVAALLLYLLMADGVLGAEVYATACSREQSGILFKSVSRIISQSKFLDEKLIPIRYKSEIKYPKADGSLKALSGESVGSHGKYPSAVVCDELHEWIGAKAESLYEALTSGFGNRKNPLVIHITTAGFGSQPTLARRLHEKAMKFAEGELEDKSFYGVIYGAELEDDWQHEDTWKKANPSFDLVKKNLRRELTAAKSEPAKENTFRRLYLNQWTQQQTRWLDIPKYDACCKPLNYEDFKGKDLIIGLDLSQIYDLTAISLLYPNEDGSWNMFVRCYMPAKQIEKRSKEDSIPYDQWAKDGFLIPTYGVSQGISIDYDQVTKDLEQIASENNLIVLAYDPSGAIQVIPTLERKGINCLNINQSFKEMSPASKEFHRRITSGLITIAANPCLRWQAGNVEIEYDSNGNYKPTKPNKKGTFGGSEKYKVDGIVAAVIAAQGTLLAYRPNAEVEQETKTEIYFL